ncbi:MAG: hypothetical protein P8M17_13395, partial [Saprospiraceae bacterium]|nr:hypothetical protein [Saprospiraceae bacterium]
FHFYLNILYLYFQNSKRYNYLIPNLAPCPTGTNTAKYDEKLQNKDTKVIIKIVRKIDVW